MSDSKFFLVQYDAVIGRAKDDGSDHEPLELTFYVTVEAPSAEAVNDIVSQYADKGFTARVTSVAELADQVSSEDLHKLLDYKKCVVEQNIVQAPVKPVKASAQNKSA